MPHDVAGLDVELGGLAAVDFEDAGDRTVGIDRGQVAGDGVGGDVHHAAVGADEDDVERNQRVLHPERHRIGRAEIEQHAFVGVEMGPVHQAERAGLGRIGELDLEMVLARRGLDHEVGEFPDRVARVVGRLRRRRRAARRQKPGGEDERRKPGLDRKWETPPRHAQDKNLTFTARHPAATDFNAVRRSNETRNLVLGKSGVTPKRPD